MLSLKQIKKAVNDIIKVKFPTIEIQAEDIKEGFKRPSFFVQFDNLDKDTGLYASDRSMTIRVYYFPSDRYVYSLEILDIQDSLDSIFNLNFAVEDRVITIKEARGQVVDKVLEFEFDINFVDSDDTEIGGNLMQEMDYLG